VRAAFVLALAAATLGTVSGATLPQDKGATGAWQRILKLRTTASAMHTTAHPDDEHGGVLAMLSRRDGARVSLLTLTRGESGDNAIGPQLVDALGLIRTDELIAADRYYGVDTQYFTTVADYGFSKRLDEALEKWGKETVLRDVVRVIRIDRPFVLISRFQGNARDGHGNHSAAGLITQDAFRAAGDPAMFPNSSPTACGPATVKAVHGGVRDNEAWTISVDTNQYSPWLGDSYGNFARLGLSFQRSQNGGRYLPQTAAAPVYYARTGSTVAAPSREDAFFEGIDTTIPGLFRALRQPEPAGAAAALETIDREVQEAIASFSMTNPSASVPALARGLHATRSALNTLSSAPDAVFILKIKEQQFQDAINAALGVELTALSAQRHHPPGIPALTELSRSGGLAAAHRHHRSSRWMEQRRPVREYSVSRPRTLYISRDLRHPLVDHVAKRQRSPTNEASGAQFCRPLRWMASRSRVKSPGVAN
jgi:LmbE family N-acetylglucosaminyl deacetylase